MSREEPEEQASGQAGWDAATPDRIVRGAAEVVFRLGVAEMSIERVRAASGASRSQVYRYFPANAISLAIYRLVPEINQVEFVRGRPSLPPRLRHDRHSGSSLTHAAPLSSAMSPATRLWVVTA